MAIRKNIYLYDEKVVEFLEKKHNQSKYIEDLIKRDMLCQNVSWTREDIMSLIKEYLEENNYNNSYVNNKQDNEAIASLKNILSL